MTGEVSGTSTQRLSHEPEPILRLGISACLLGHEVRYNGAHKRDDFLVHTLGTYVEWYPLCPEVEIGLGVPRETIRLTSSKKEHPRLVATQSGNDHTETMRDWARVQFAESTDGGFTAMC